MPRERSPRGASDEFCDSLQAWGHDIARPRRRDPGLRSLAAGVPDVASQTLAIQLLRANFPRLASMLTLAGAIVDDPGLGSHVDWEKLRDFMLVTPELVDESFWDELFGPGDKTAAGWWRCSRRCSIVAPETITALNIGDMRHLAPAAAADADRRLGRTGEPTREQHRLGADHLPTASRQGGAAGDLGLPDLRGGFVPEPAISLLFRSQRRPSAGRTVTDFEFWAYPSVDAAESRGPDAARQRRSP